MEQPNIFVSYLRVTQHMSQQFRSHFGRLDLTFPQALVLTVLGEDGPVPISALAERTGSANSTVSGIVDRLEKLGLARRQRSETDRRVSYVCATEKSNAQRYEPGGPGHDRRRLPEAGRRVASGWDRAVRTVIERAKNGQAIQAWPGECREEGGRR